MQIDYNFVNGVFLFLCGLITIWGAVILLNMKKGGKKIK